MTTRETAVPDQRKVNDMESKMPPIPEQNRSMKGTGEAQRASPADPHPLQQTPDPDKKGHQGNSKINTTHQGYQQDR